MGINGDGIAFFNKSDRRAPNCCFWRNVIYT
jgi:hypothetical protein